MAIADLGDAATNGSADGLQFGTSGLRGPVTAMTDRACYAYVRGYLQYLAELGEFGAGGTVALAGDLRPSTPAILGACAQAVRDLGGTPLFCGYIPTPALAFHAIARRMPSIMVTGSHIPEDRNGIKFYRPHGEVLKEDEAGILRQQVPYDAAAFDAAGAFVAPVPLPAPVDVTPAYVQRYVAFFGAGALTGRRIGVYQHSAVGRDLLVAILQALGAETLALGRSERFVPVDTEAIRPEDVVLARQWAAETPLDAIVSTDGDSDRPLLADASGTWLRGDVLGVLCARYLGADHVVTPVSSNTLLEKCGSFARVARTRIGSPYVIAAMNAALAEGGARVCGYEANGGFLLGSDIALAGRALTALPTRDAVLPIVAAIVAGGAGGLGALLGALPPRVTYSDRIKDYPVAQSRALMQHLTDGDQAAQLARAAALLGDLAGEPVAVDLTDGFRVTFASGSIIHFRPSGNAPELRCYTEADSEAEAVRLNQAALALVRDAAPPATA